jgi:hypothetical protein
MTSLKRKTLILTKKDPASTNLRGHKTETEVVDSGLSLDVFRK